MNLKDLGFKKSKLEKLEGNNISTVDELLYKEPRKYMYFDKVHTLELSEEILEIARNKEAVVLSGKVINVELDVTKQNVSVTKIKVENEENRCRLYVNIFGSYKEFDMYEKLLDQIVYFGGKLHYNRVNDRDFLSMSNPELVTTCKNDLKIYPVYSKYKGISEDFYKGAVMTAYKDMDNDYLPLDIIKKYKLLSRKDAVKAIHYPTDREKIRKAQQRIVFDNLFYFASKVQNNNAKSNVSGIIPQKEGLLKEFIGSLPYSLTDDQRNAINLIKEKMKEKQTFALVQGDVSCGKTIVAMSLMFLMAENGYQSVLMAPTVILARQHYDELAKYAGKYGLSVAFLSSEMSAAAKKKIAKDIEDNKHLLIVGTHSCFSKELKYSNLGLVITDEEHKFGVVQKEAVTEKSVCGVHNITMSATPIGRTLACSIYGDNTEVITIKQMPSGRKPVQTAICTSDKPIFSFMERELKKGHQAYVVCPLIDKAESDTVMEGIASVEEVEKKYRHYFEPLGYKIAVITGKTTSEEQEYIKSQMKNNDVQILIATTVIEVGINIPNATVITITSAERFGLATLHQLRGRVGRGDKQSYCILQKSLSTVESDNLKILEKETDGFEIAKADLQRRGSGNILGTEQSGNNKFIDLIIQYPNMYECVKKIAEKININDRKAYIEDFERRYPCC